MVYSNGDTFNDLNMTVLMVHYMKSSLVTLKYIKIKILMVYSMEFH